VSSRTTLERWLRPVGVVIVAAVIIDGPAEQPAPGLHGDRLGVLLALAAFAVGLLGARERCCATRRCGCRCRSCAPWSPGRGC
jgi:hypothetical protein